LCRGEKGEPWDGRDQTIVLQETATNDLILVILPIYTVYEDGTEHSEMLAYKIQTPGNHPKERIQL